MRGCEPLSTVLLLSSYLLDLSLPVRILLPMRTAFLFTGQGSQHVGMGKALCESYSAAREAFAEADEVLGCDLSKLCWQGPEQDLALTINTQPATLTVSIAAFRCLGFDPDVAAGHSLGEYSALTAAGTFTFGDALSLVRERARRMQAAVPLGSGGMVVVRKMNLAQVREIVAKVTSGVCEVANVNAPGQTVLSGEQAAMDEVIELVGPRKGLHLPVSVPFHSSLLGQASAGFAELLDAVEMHDPRFPIYCNVDAKPVTSAAMARDALKRQFANPVLWQASIERMLRQESVQRFIELGPKPTLVRMVTQISNALGIDSVETATACSDEEVANISK